MKLEIGLSHRVFGKRPPLEEDFRQFHDFNIRNMEVSLFREWPLPYTKETVTEVCRNVMQWLEKYDIQAISVHGPSGMPGRGHWLADPDEAMRKKNVAERRLILEGAKMIGAKYMIVEYERYDRWPFWPHKTAVETSYPRAYELWKKSVEELIAEADRCGVKIAIENIDGLPWEQMMQTVLGWPPDVVGICFDSSHATYGGKFFEQLDCFKDRIIGTHLSDNDALSGMEWKDRHWCPFQGVINWDRLVEILVSAKTVPNLMVEAWTPNQDITPDLSGAIEKLRCLAAQK